ncbi:hypothetical protein WR25_21900 [Diploscapter pachys]|uniref:Thioredoxin domain-containing protein n=1 Tax=Diploscapter pachys TaxID=2018661 RepID=A0A2A2LYT6_9BILA|nr:hypothetical protein WR25_21900 [Diploscapter pachys]
MRVSLLLASSLFLVFFLSSSFVAHAKKNNKNVKVSVSDDVPVPSPSTTKKSHQPSASSGGKKESAKKKEEPTRAGGKHRDDDNSIDDVDEDKIDEILRDASKNLVIFFYDGRAQCPSCGEALSEVEEIDDDIEATGYVQVVKTDDRSVARELGVTTFPSLVYYRRKNPITYDGDFKDSETVLRWLRSHEEVVTWDLTDDTFEYRTDSHSPDEGTLDWFVMFYDSEDNGCNSFVPIWETVAHKLRGLVHVGKVDTNVNDDVTERFHIDEKDCPTFLLLHRGKMYRYKDTAKDIRSLVNFALYKFKELRGHRVPNPPTALEHLYEFTKEKIHDMMDDNQTLSVVAVGGLIVIVAITLIVKAYRIKQEKKNE